MNACAIVSTVSTAPAALGRSLTESERRRFAAIVGEEPRRNWLAGRMAAKVAVAAMTGIATLDRLEIRDSPGDAPRAAAKGARSGWGVLALELSLSHSGGRGAAMAATGGSCVGVDLETDGTARPEHARYYLTAPERGWVPLHGLTALWALKEAAWKAVRPGDDTPFTAVSVRFDGAGRVRRVRLGYREHAARAWLTRPWPGFVLAALIVGARI